jgi:hypothetical protein
MAADTEMTSRDDLEAEHIRTIERARLRALVEANMELARALHADDFQLITPTGAALSKEEYLGNIASGHFDYRVWEPDVITVRMRGTMALLRYQAHLDIVVGGHDVAGPHRRYWHTDSYERRDGRWQVVWSQATEIRSP